MLSTTSLGPSAHSPRLSGIRNLRGKHISDLLLNRLTAVAVTYIPVTSHFVQHGAESKSAWRAFQLSYATRSRSRQLRFIDQRPVHQGICPMIANTTSLPLLPLAVTSPCICAEAIISTIASNNATVCDAREVQVSGCSSSVPRQCAGTMTWPSHARSAGSQQSLCTVSSSPHELSLIM